MSSSFPLFNTGCICMALWLWLGAFGLAQSESRWAGAGLWQTAARWSAGVPGSLTRAVVTGRGEVVLERGRQVVGGLDIGPGKEDHARLTLRGGELIVRRVFLCIGDLKGGAGEVLVDGGTLHDAGPIYIGSANFTTDRACSGTLRVRGGEVVARLATLGWGGGSKALLSIEGSRARAVRLLDYLMLSSRRVEAPSTNTLAFTLDEHGVTPVTTGRLIVDRSTPANACRLQITLSAVPPREDVTLITASQQAQGTFDGLPEGAEISAEHGGRTFRWTLTYRGGAGGHDLVLTKVRGHSATDAVTKTAVFPAPPEPLWPQVPLRPPLPSDLPPAFAGAEGFGAIAVGGRGGREIAVTHLGDGGPGSLRAALAEKGPRRIVFKTGGTIVMKDALVIREPFVSILGQSAPLPGITLRGGGIIVRTHDVVLQHLRIRPGDEAVECDSVELEDAQRCILDHCSFGWATDETCSVVDMSDAVTIQYCILSEGLNRPQHNALHSMASIAGGERVTWHHNLIAHCGSRNPRFAYPTSCDFRNNVVYNWGGTPAQGEWERVNFVANYYRPGPSTLPSSRLLISGGSSVLPGTLFAAGNILDGDEAATRENWRAIGHDRRVQAPAPFTAPAVTTQDAAAALENVLKNAGATLPARDAGDTRVIDTVRTRTGRIPRTVEEAGGWPQ